METRELYKQKYEAQMHEWSAKLDLMRARSEKLSAQAKLDAKPRIDAAHAKLEHARHKLAAVGTTAEANWSEIGAQLDLAWDDVKAAFEGAYDAVHDANAAKPAS